MPDSKPPSPDARQRRRDAELEQLKGTTANAPAPEGSFKNYTKVPGKPGMEVDPHGHYRFTPPYAG